MPSARIKTVNEIVKMMKQKERVRNIGIIAHIDYGKTTLTDFLLAEAGLLSPTIAGQARALLLHHQSNQFVATRIMGDHTTQNTYKNYKEFSFSHQKFIFLPQKHNFS